MPTKILTPQAYNVHVESSVNGFFHRITHEKMEKFSKNEYANILEVGAGDGQHIKYVKSSYKRYTMLDLEPSRNKILNRKIRYVVGDIQHLPFKDNLFEKVIITCLMHHIEKPILGLQEIRRVAKPGAEVVVLLPTDPGIVFRALRKIFADSKLKKNNIENIDLLRATDHRNHFSSLRTMIEYTFATDEIKICKFPLILDSWNLNLFYIFHVKVAEIK